MISLFPRCGLVLLCSSESIPVAYTEEKIPQIEKSKCEYHFFRGKRRLQWAFFLNSLDNCSLFNNRPSLRVKLLRDKLSSALTAQALKSFCTFKLWFHCGCSACIVLLLLFIPHIQRLKPGVLNSGPQGPHSCRVYSPACNFLVILKILISLFRCVWLGLKLNSAWKWTVRARVENPWLKLMLFVLMISSVMKL